MIRLPRATALLCSVALPILILHFMASDDRTAVGLAVAPFATLRLLIAHIVAVLPLAIVVRQSIGSRISFGVRIGVAVGTSICVLIFMPVCADMMNDDRAAFGVRVGCRCMIALVLVAAGLLASWEAETMIARPWTWVAGLVFACVPTAVYSDRVRANIAQEFPAHLQSQQFIKARADMDSAADLGDYLASGKRSPTETRKLLSQKIASLEMAVAKPLPPSADDPTKLTRVMNYLSLSRPNDAEALLSSMPQDQIDVRLLNMAVAKERQDWYALEAHAQQLLTISTDAELTAMATDNLIESLRKRGRWIDAETLLKQAINDDPKRSAARYLQLGLLSADRGKIYEAQSHFDMAEQLDPSLANNIEAPRRRIKANSFSCFQR